MLAARVHMSDYHRLFDTSTTAHELNTEHLHPLHRAMVKDCRFDKTSRKTFWTVFVEQEIPVLARAQRAYRLK